MGKLALTDVYGPGSLAPIKQVVGLLQRETSINKIAEFSSKIEALRRYDNKNLERRNYWGELAIWSTRRMGVIIREGQDKGVIASKGQPKKVISHDVILLEDIGIEPMQSSRAKELADVPEETIREFVTRQNDIGDEVSKAGLKRFATGTEKAGTAAHVSQNTGVPEWYTPSDYIEAARAALGVIEDSTENRQGENILHIEGRWAESGLGWQCMDEPAIQHGSSRQIC